MNLSSVLYTFVAALLFVSQSANGNPAKEISKSLATHEAVALFFLGTDCPVSNRYIPLVKEWNASLRDRGALVVGVYSEKGITAQATTEHTKEYEVDFPTVRDAEGSFADAMGVSRLATVIILDDKGVLRYRGRFDNVFSKEGTAPTRIPEAGNAMDSILKGEPVTVPETEVSACTLDGTLGGGKVAIGEKVVAQAELPTYHRDIAPVLEARCTECHSSGGVAPFSLDNYASARKRGEDMLEEIDAMRMPPWHAAPGKLEFMNENHVEPEEKALLQRWLETGAAEGIAEKRPDPIPAPAREEWRIGTPDEVLSFQKSEKIPALAPPGGLPYRYVKIGEPFDQERWVRASQIIPGDRSVVHHSIIYIVAPGQVVPMGGTGGEALSAADKIMIRLMSPEKLGDVIAEEAEREPTMLQAYVPGDDSFDHPEDLGRLIPRGAQLVAEMHYTPGGKETEDQTRIGLIYHDVKPDREVRDLVAMALDIDIPPGAARHKIRAVSAALKTDVDLLSFNAHMHLRGKEFRFILRKPDGKRELLLDIPRYDFNWQTTYRLATPLALEKGSRIECEAVFDNSAANFSNPNPEGRVGFGEQTTDEMMIGSMEYTSRP